MGYTCCIGAFASSRVGQKDKTIFDLQCLGGVHVICRWGGLTVVLYRFDDSFIVSAFEAGWILGALAVCDCILQVTVFVLVGVGFR